MTARSESNFIYNQALNAAFDSKGIAADSVISSDQGWVQDARQNGYNMISITGRELAGLVSTIRLAITAGELPKLEGKFDAEVANLKGAIATNLSTMLTITNPDHQFQTKDFKDMADTFFAKTLELHQNLQKKVATGSGAGIHR